LFLIWDLLIGIYLELVIWLFLPAGRQGDFTVLWHLEQGGK
jgi:hypothetical protein